MGVWTVDDPTALQQMIGAGCDAIITNDPKTLMKLQGQGVPVLQGAGR